MIENLSVAFQISLLGMGLVFGAILLLWGVLALLVRLTTERRSEDAPTTEATFIPSASPAPSNHKATLARAAAAAVAAALALNEGQKQTEPPSTAPSSTISAWQAVMRATLLNSRRPRR